MSDTRQARAELTSTLLVNGVDDLHSWRCAHPDIYGPCECVAELVESLLPHLAAAWDEGAEYAGGSDHFWHDGVRETNPYRVTAGKD